MRKKLFTRTLWFSVYHYHKLHSTESELGSGPYLNPTNDISEVCKETADG